MSVVDSSVHVPDGAIVSVVIPVWGEYDTTALDQAVSSARHPMVEVLIVDNASTLPVERPCRTIRLPERVSLGSARNAALGQILTPYVVFLDADDQLAPGALDHMLLIAHQELPKRVVVAARLLDTVRDKEYRWPRSWQRRSSRYPRIFALLESVRPAFPVQGSLLPVDAVCDAGGYGEAEDAAEDWVLGVSLSWRCEVLFAEVPTMLYTPHPKGRWQSSSRLRDHLAHRSYVRDRLASDSATRGLRPWLPALRIAHTLGAVRERVSTLSNSLGRALWDFSWGGGRCTDCGEL